MADPKLSVVSSSPLPDPPYPGKTRSGAAPFHVDMERIRASDTWLLTPPEVRPWLILLWCMAWTRVPAGSLPDDDEVIAATIGMPFSLFALHRKPLMRHWQKHSDGRLYHRVVTELVLSMLKGREGFASRQRTFRLKHKQRVVDNVTRDSPVSHAAVTDCSGSGSGSGSGSTTPTTTTTSTTTTKAGGAKPTAGGPAALVKTKVVSLPDWLPKPEWDAFRLMRKSIRKPLTDHGEHLLLLKLGKLKADGEDPIAVVQQSVENSYAGLFPVKQGAANSGKTQRPPTREERILAQGVRIMDDLRRKHEAVDND